MGSIKVNMQHMHKWKVDQDNVKFYNHIRKNKGQAFFTLDTRPYVEYLNEFGIFYTLT